MPASSPKPSDPSAPRSAANESPRGARWPFVVGGILLLGCCLAIAIPNVIELRMGDAETYGIGGLRTLTTAQALFREGDKDKNGRLEYAASLQQLSDAQLIDPVFASGTKRGFVFRIVAASEFTWSATATKLAAESGDRSFFVDESGVIRFATTGTATSGSMAIGG